MVLENETQGNYLVVSQSIMHDKALKLFDRGLLVTLMSLPDNWNFTIRGLAVILCDGRDAIAGGLKRLQERGYLVKEQLRDNGQFSDICLRINMTPDLSGVDDESDMSVYEMTKLAESSNEEASIGSMSEDTPSDTSLEESVPAIPMPDKPLPEKPSTEMSSTGKPLSGIPTQLNNKESNIQESNNHKSNTQGDKTGDVSFYILTLAAIAEELKYLGYEPRANVILAVGLPLAWTVAQRKSFREYLKQNEEPEFVYKGTHFHLHIEKVKIFAQGLAESCLLESMDGDSMIADIGNGTMNIVRFVDGSPLEKSIATEKYGVGTCIRNIREELSRLKGCDIEERIIDRLIREGCRDRTDEIATVTDRMAREYAAEIIKRLEDHGYVDGYVRLNVFGGGGCLLKNYSALGDKPCGWDRRTRRDAFFRRSLAEPTKWPDT